MKKTERVIDINAHITNISSKIEIENDAAYALLSFENLGYGTISAIKLKAQGFNSFGDIIRVNGKEQFNLIIQDLKVEKNESIKSIKVKLPSNEIRRLELEENQICYFDGTVLNYSGADDRLFETEEFDTSEDEREALQAIKELVSAEAKIIPQEYDIGWLCSCGRYNPNNSDICSKCGVRKEDIFKITSSGYISELIIRHHKNEERQREKERIEKEREKKTAQKKRLIIGICAILGIILVLIMRPIIVMSGRSVYSSEEEMKAALQGTYSFHDGSGEVKKQIVINGDTLIYKWLYDNSSLREEIKRWEYDKGIIHTFEDIVVTKDGNLKVDNSKLYEKEYIDLSKYDYEDGNEVLKVYIRHLEQKDKYVVCSGVVKNTGTQTYNHISVTGTFKDSNGEVVATDWDGVRSYEPLSPGESELFEVRAELNNDIESCEVVIDSFKYVDTNN